MDDLDVAADVATGKRFRRHGSPPGKRGAETPTRDLVVSAW
jgi:hypothetical protein